MRVKDSFPSLGPWRTEQPFRVLPSKLPFFGVFYPETYLLPLQYTVTCLVIQFIFAALNTSMCNTSAMWRSCSSDWPG